MSREASHRRGDMSRPALSIRRTLAAEESRNMQEVMQGDAGSQQAPAPGHTRVRKMGRTIKDRGEICQWIQGMIQDDPAPGAPPSIVSAKTCSGVEIEQKDSVASAATVVPAPAGLRECPPTLLPGAARAVGGGGNSASSQSHRNNDFPVSNESVHSNNSVSESEADLSHSSAKKEGEEPSYEEQLDLIRHQQQQLLEQQRIIQEKLDEKQSQSKRESESATQQAQPQDSRTLLSTTEAKSETEMESQAPSRSTSAQGRTFGPDARRRRLKGSLASHYAERDEGCIGTLLWSRDQQEEEKEGKQASSTTLHSAVSCVSASRQANLKQDSSTSVSQLLSYSSSFRDRSSRSELCRKASCPTETRRGELPRAVKAGSPVVPPLPPPPLPEPPASTAASEPPSKVYDCECEFSASSCVPSCTSCSEWSALPPKP